MDSRELLKLIDLLQQERVARIASDAAFGQMISDLNATIIKLNQTIGNLLEENRLLRTPKKNSGNSSVPPSKDENRPRKTVSLRGSSGKPPGGQTGHEGSTLKMTSVPDQVIEHKTIEENFPAGFPNGILVHDCWKSHFNTSAKGHQICTAHLLRELKFFEEKYKSAWASNFKQMLYLALELNKIMLPAQYGRPVKARAELESKLEVLLQEKIHEDHIEVATFQRRILKYKEYLFTFLYHCDVPPDNNASERTIRNIKVKQKISGMFKAPKGAQIYAIIRSITDTCTKNGQSILNAFSTIAQLQPE